MQTGSDNQRPMLIGGTLVGSESGEWLEAINPANEEILGYVPMGTRADIDRAVQAGLAAYPAWASLSPDQRAGLLRTVGEKLVERADEILGVEVRDTGNTITPMRNDVQTAVNDLNYYAGLGYELKGETIPSSSGNLHLTLREPYGVVGRIVPFNHPIMFAVSRTAAPLIAGNTVVLKPPETSSLSATILAEICREVLPPGVINIVTGVGADAGDALVRHPQVKRIAFTGSAATGMKIQKAAAEVSVKHITLELGGKNPLIVFPDARLEAAEKAAVNGMNFAWQGQSCGSTSRLLLHESVYDELLERVVTRVSRLKIGDPLSERSEMGPINSRTQYEKVLKYISIAREDGAVLATGGAHPKGKEFERGYWVQPTVFSDVTPTMRIAHEEVFGPVLAVMRWRDTEEAIAIANATSYGLTAAIWTENLNTALDTARRLRSGYVWINGVGTHYRAAPFGGMKNSGVGREEAGIEELLSFTETKTLHFVRS